MTEFKRRKAEFVAKHGDQLLLADDAKQRVMCTELEDLARYAKLPAARLLQAVAKLYAETT